MKRHKVNIFKILLLAALLIMLINLVTSPVLGQKVYVDVTSAGIRKLPVAIQAFQGGKEISDVVRDDIDYTGLFYCIQDSAHIERPEQPFNPANWRATQAEIVVKGQVVRDKRLSVVISVYDVSEGREVLRKEYSASNELYRPLAHAIANDIYKLLTGQQGIFRTKIAFVGEKAKGKELIIMDWDGHRQNELGIKAEILLTPRWTTDGSKLIYSKQINREWGIFVLDINNMQEKNIAASKGLIMSGNFLPGNKEFVFVSSKDGNADIYIGDIINMKTKMLTSSPWIDVSPSVSPDGKRLLFVSNRAGSPQIYLAGIDGSNPKRITFEGSYNTSPVWSPKGDKIAYTSMTAGRHQIFLMNADGSNPIQLTTAGNNEDPSFSPDGRYIAFTSDRDGVKGIYLMRIDGEGQKRITPRGSKASNPSWSTIM